MLTHLLEPDDDRPRKKRSSGEYDFLDEEPISDEDEVEEE